MNIWEDITLTKKNFIHRKMMDALDKKIMKIWEAQKQGSHEAAVYMRYCRPEYVNMDLDFRNGKPVAFWRYYIVRNCMKGTLKRIRAEKKNCAGAN